MCSDAAPPRDGKPFGEAIHATAVAIGTHALLITGASRAGKSRLALSLITASTRRRPIRLIGDDCVLLVQRRGALVVRGHPRIRGFIEQRGLGIVASPFIEAAPTRGIVHIGSKTSSLLALQNFPCLSIVTLDDMDAARERVLRWWRGASTTQRAKPSVAA